MCSRGTDGHRATRELMLVTNTEEAAGADTDPRRAGALGRIDRRYSWVGGYSKLDCRETERQKPSIPRGRPTGRPVNMVLGPDGFFKYYVLPSSE